MKILHISRDDFHGAGLCAYRMHRSLLRNGLDSSMLVLYKTQNDNKVFSVFKLRYFVYRLFHFILRKFGILCCEYDKLIYLSSKYKVPFTRPLSPFDLSRHPLVQDADVIHFHWVDDFFNQKSFLYNVKKPIVWTLHDEGIFYGISHYSDTVLSDHYLEKKYCDVKISMIGRAHKLHFVLLSNYFKEKFSDSVILRSNSFSVINNSVDCSQFIMYNKIESRNQLGLDNQTIYLSFLASDISDRRKGLDTLLEAISLIKDLKIKIIAIGNDVNFIPNDNVVSSGLIKDPRILSLYLSASDCFVLPSLHEAFSQAPLEAMACGVPVVITPVSGAEELITENNGCISNDFTPISLAESIIKVLSSSYNPKLIRNYVLNKFSPNVIARQYINVYKSL